MYFSRIRFRPDLSAGKIARIIHRTPYQEHQQLWTLFSESKERKFLFRKEPDCFYVVSERVPCDQQGLWHIETKQYDPKPAPGGHYRFILRVNPVIKRTDGTQKSHLHDVVMDAKRALNNDNSSNKPPHNAIVMNSGKAWLSPRAENNGFHVDEDALLVDRYQQHRILKKGKTNPISFSTLDFSGILVVTNKEQLKHALMFGIGRSKAFGCGLLSLARI